MRSFIYSTCCDVPVDVVERLWFYDTVIICTSCRKNIDYADRIGLEQLEELSR